MVLVEELLECDDCQSRVSQPVDEDQIGLLAAGGDVELFCKVCRNITSWRYQHIKINGPRYEFATDPLLETFEAPQPKAPESFPPDPLLIGYQSILDNPAILSPRVELEWYD